MKNKLCIILIFIFQLNFSQIPSVAKNYTFDNFIEAFIKINRDEYFKPDSSIIIISSLYYEGKGYMVTILRDNIESLVNPLASNLEYYKYNNFDLLLQGKKSEDVEFLKKIIKRKMISNSSKIKFKEPNKNVSCNPYVWYLLFDEKMKLKDYTLQEEEVEIEKIFKEYNIRNNSKKK
ncbi:MAG: hypothetical protein KA232_12215 [Chryseobacterium sp.]|nr:hypothetical protein [Chryseobacterium sp.]